MKFVELDDSSSSYSIKSSEATLARTREGFSRQEASGGLNSKKRKSKRLERTQTELNHPQKATSNKTDNLLRETQSSIQKRRRRHKDGNCENSSIHSNRDACRPMLVIEKNCSHYYVPRTFDLPERLQFLNLNDCLNPSKTAHQEQPNSYRPRIGRVSRELVRRQREALPEARDRRGMYERTIASLSERVEALIRQSDTQGKGSLNYDELCGLLLQLSKRNGPFEAERIAQEILNLIKPSNESISDERLYNLLMILVGTKSLSWQVTFELLQDFVRREGTRAVDLGSLWCYL